MIFVELELRAIISTVLCTVLVIAIALLLYRFLKAGKNEKALREILFAQFQRTKLGRKSFPALFAYG